MLPLDLEKRMDECDIELKWFWCSFIWQWQQVQHGMKMPKHPGHKSLVQNISALFSRNDVEHENFMTLLKVTNHMVTNVNMFSPPMKFRIKQEIQCILIITHKVK